MFAGAALAVVLALSGSTWAYFRTAEASRPSGGCCSPGADCCYPGSPCCEECCYPGSPCCFPGSPCCDDCC